MPLHSPLPRNVRHGLASISGSLFIQNKTTDCGEHRSYHTGHEVMSSVSLQMALYFNIFFFPFWFISEIIMLELKYFLLTCYYQFLLITAVTIITLIEVLRLYLGYIGNLNEKVPELAGFLLLTFLIQMPLFLFLLTDEKILILPLEFAVHVIYVVFLNTELLVSFCVLKIMTRQLATQFYLHQTDDLENKNVPARCSQVTILRSKRSMIELQERDALMY
ncbi:PREDICTED: transmembrane protein 17B-like [Nanorana parkeri]|uniref:transmembrane protein 17B-like n=1 Tax=Nanorana parkeri TaxID=125878 RepID=UPI000854D987|nr:PREDICTED: transmembrane protein 17B-like [Nanorana parkeri]